MAKAQSARTKKGAVSLPPRTSYTQISNFQRCKTRFYWRYILGLERVAPSVGLYRGKLLHEAYDEYMFRDREDHAIAHDVVDRMVQEELDQGTADAEFLNEIADEAHECLNHYLPWADENDNWTVVVPKRATKCEVTGEYGIELPDGSSHPVVFKIDALVQQDDKLMMLENKFRKNLDATGLEHDLQILLYQAFWNALHPDHRIEGVIYNIVAAKPRKKDGAVGTREYFYRGEQEERIAINNARAVLMEQRMQAELNLWPMNASKDCNWDCDFVGMCLGVRAGATVAEYVNTGEYRYRNP